MSIGLAILMLETSIMGTYIEEKEGKGENK